MKVVKIKAEIWEFDGNTSYKIINIESCCDEIRNNPLIDFYAVGFENSDDEYGVALCEIDTYPVPYEDDYLTDYRYYKINRCPFCGEFISIEVVRELDKTCEYKQLKSEVHNLLKTINKCDSKKREREIKTEYREKNELLNDFYHNGTIKIDID